MRNLRDTDFLYEDVCIARLSYPHLCTFELTPLSKSAISEI